MDGIEVLHEAFGRVHGSAHAAGADLSAEQLTWRADPEANTIAWLVWHLTRVQDDHVASVAEVEQVWTAQGWTDRFALPFADADIGYGHSAEEVGAVAAPSTLLTGYLDAVHEQTLRFLGTIADADLDRIVDVDWDPPVTLGVRLVSVVSDDLQHAGQAAILRGMVGRRG
ncbi:MAG: DinB family protein [Pseudonocardia sp.]|nr:DinB family protein [Pseudonocardia sp.]